MTALLEMKSLSVGYGGTPVLREISTSLAPAGLTALIGPNGSGKSTFLRAAAGLLPYSGSLTLQEKELRLWRRPELGLRVGLQTQRTAFSFPFTVCDVIGLGRLPHSRRFERPRGDDSLIIEAARAVDVERLLLRPVTELSGGEGQRVMMALLLAQDPDVFLLDEPTSALDPRQALALFGLIRGLADRGKSVVVAVHDVNSALAWADSIVGLKGGRLLFHERASDVGRELLEEVYDTPFEAYHSKGGRTLWHASSPSSRSF